MMTAVSAPLLFLGRHWGKMTLLIVVLAVVLVIRSRPIAVERHTVTTGMIASETLGTGTLDARTRATVGAKIAGRIDVISADQGDRVKKDQQLAHIDDADLRRQVSTAEATWRASQSSVVRVKADRVRAQAVVDQAQRDRKRLEPLREANIASQDTYEQAGERLAVAEADLTRSIAAITEAEQQEGAAQENLRMYQARLAEATITAPFDGLVVRRDRDIGDIVVPGTTLMLVVATDTLWVSAWVDESAMAAIAVGQTARIVLRSDPTKSHVGEVLRVGREVDRESREFLVDVRIADPPAQWAIGQRAEVFIRTAAVDGVVRLPWRFKRTRDGVDGVWLDDHGYAAWRPLALGLRGLDAVAVTKGLAAGEVVIIPVGGPTATLQNGQRTSSR
jgi:HlyD family secretion protein